MLSLRISESQLEELQHILDTLRLERSLFLRTAIEALKQEPNLYTSAAKDASSGEPKTERISFAVPMDMYGEMEEMLGSGEIMSFARVALHLAIVQCKGKEQVAWPLRF